MRKLLRDFVAVADHYSRWQTAVPVKHGVYAQFLNRSGLTSDFSNPSSRWHGHRGEAGPPIGVYALAPSGMPLGEVNATPRGPDGDAIRKLLVAARAKYRKLSRAERLLSGSPPASVGQWRWQDVAPRKQVPPDTVALRVYTRDLPRDPLPGRNQTYAIGSWNSGFAWLERAETILPEALTPGAENAVPSWMVRRVARYHLVDNVLGRTLPYADDDIERAEMTARVTRVDGPRVHLRLRGRTRAVARGRWRLCESHTRPSRAERGYESQLYGWVTWNRSSKRFTRFDLVAVGTRWGSTSGNRRYVAEYPPLTDDRAPSPMGVAFQLFDGQLEDAVPPYFLWTSGPTAYFKKSE